MEVAFCRSQKYITKHIVHLSTTDDHISAIVCYYTVEEIVTWFHSMEYAGGIIRKIGCTDGLGLERMLDDKVFVLEQFACGRSRRESCGEFFERRHIRLYFTEIFTEVAVGDNI